MKTTIDIPEETLKEAMRLTKARTKREAVVAAVEEFNRKKRMSELVKWMGVSDTFMAHDELMTSRKAR